MPTYLREVLGDVQDIIEDAAQKDSYIAKTHKRLSTRLGFNVSANASFHLCASNTYLEIGFSSNELFSQGPLPNSPVTHRASRGSSCDLCVLPLVAPPCLEMLIQEAVGELGPDVKISELLWTFSRLPEDQRISLKQNPHFYFSKDLSDQASAYDDQFKLEPLKDLRPMKDLVVMVLLDRAGQIFVDYQQFSKTYGNIWRPDNTIILKGKKFLLAN